MSDIFREVEEDVRRERLEKFWKTYGDYVIAAVAAILLGVAAYVFWDKHQAAERAKAAIAFSDAQKIVDPARAAAAYAKIAATAPSGYARLATMEEANALFVTGDRAKAIALYKNVAAKDDGPVGGAARLRAGWAMADSVSRAELAQWLSPLTKTNTAWSQMGREILAYVDYRSGRTAVAATEFQALATDFQAPNGVRQRAGAMAAFIRNGAGKNFGTVPPPQPAAPEPAPEKPAP